jgi:dihydroorotate dehydrogenase
MKNQVIFHLHFPLHFLYYLSLSHSNFLTLSSMPFFQDFSIMNASGPHCTTLEELERIAQSDADYIVMKSCTLEPREGNPSPRYAAFE